jgi:hypothetical protein
MGSMKPPWPSIIFFIISMPIPGPLHFSSILNLPLLGWFLWLGLQCFSPPGPDLFREPGNQGGDQDHQDDADSQFLGDPALKQVQDIGGKIINPTGNSALSG